MRVSNFRGADFSVAMMQNFRKYLFVLILILAVVQQVLLRGYTMDDAFISFRYARNVAQGLGWVYNPGGPQVEGFSNFLWTLMFIPAYGLKLNPMIVAQVMGSLCSLVVLWLTWKMAQSGVENRLGLAPLWAPFLTAITGSFTYQAVTGLETHLFTLGLVGGVFFFLRRDRQSLLYSALFFVVASLTRPEGPVLFGISLIFLIIALSRRQIDSIPLVYFITAYALPMVLYLLWRKNTFGHWLPNTYYAKVGSPWEMLPGGLTYVYEFFRNHGAALPWIIALIPLIWHRRRNREVYLITLLFAWLAVVIYEGGDWMPLHRMLSPILPVLFILVAEGLDILYREWVRIRQERNFPKVLSGSLFSLWILAIVAVLGYPSLAVIKESFRRPALYENSHVALGKWLKAKTEPQDKIALSDIGQIGYFSERPVIDLVGLTDPVIARSPGKLHQKQYDPLYVLDQKPKFIVLVCYKDKGEYRIRGFETEMRLYQQPRFQEEYFLKPVISQKFHYKDEYTYLVFERKG